MISVGIRGALTQGMSNEQYEGALITVEIHRGTVDPGGIGSDEEYQDCKEYVLTYVREQFPGATVRAVGNGGRTSGLDRSGRSIEHAVKIVVANAFEEWCR